ncbi:MAG: PhzF family phenazine biosynthesis protein [Nodosilinea sp.]
MAVPLIQVDAFTNQAYGGNPAAVCPLPGPYAEDWMQRVAREMNLSETAFFYPEADGYRLRWFTPTTEVDLCGHATLATAHILWSEGYLAEHLQARFYTHSGVLTARRQENWIELNFPTNPSHPITVPAGLEEALGATPIAVMENSLGYLVELESADLVQQLNPNFRALKALPVAGVTVTSQASAPYDFISRFFAPNLGINEDPATGSSHCCLSPYWRDRLHKTTFLAYQASPRGGVIKLEDEGDRIRLSGQAVTVLKGELFH